MMGSKSVLAYTLMIGQASLGDGDDLESLLGNES